PTRPVSGGRGSVAAASARAARRTGRSFPGRRARAKRGSIAPRDPRPPVQPAPYPAPSGVWGVSRSGSGTSDGVARPGGEGRVLGSLYRRDAGGSSGSRDDGRTAPGNMAEVGRRNGRSNQCRLIGGWRPIRTVPEASIAVRLWLGW